MTIRYASNKIYFMPLNRGGYTCSLYVPHIANPKLQRAATEKSKTTNLFAIYISVTLALLERLMQVILYGMLATTVRFYSISRLCNRNKK